MPQVNVTISGKAYRMACGEGEEPHLEALAQLYDGKIEEMRQAFGEIGDMRLHVMAALMVAGRVGAAMAAELGTMRVTEQIDALTTLSTNPFKYLIVPRGLAGVLMLLYLAASKTRWGLGHLLTGILLGALNFANIYTYIRAHQSLPGNPALVFSVMNMGVIVLGTLVSAMAFREPLSKHNLLGVLLALGAIFVMVPR